MWHPAMRKCTDNCETWKTITNAALTSGYAHLSGKRAVRDATTRVSSVRRLRIYDYRAVTAPRHQPGASPPA